MVILKANSPTDLAKAIEFFSEIVGMKIFSGFGYQVFARDLNQLESFKARDSKAVFQTILQSSQTILILFKDQITLVSPSKSKPSLSKNWAYSFVVSIPLMRDSFNFRLSDKLLDCQNPYRLDSPSSFAYTWTTDGLRIYLRNTQNSDHTEIFEIIYDKDQKPVGYIRRMFLGDVVYCFYHKSTAK